MNSNRYFLELINNNNVFKVVNAKKLIQVNQHKKTWKKVSARGLAREINKTPILIK